jgi:hypothetical protein
LAIECMSGGAPGGQCFTPTGVRGGWRGTFDQPQGLKINNYLTSENWYNED